MDATIFTVDYAMAIKRALVSTRIRRHSTARVYSHGRRDIRSSTLARSKAPRSYTSIELAADTESLNTMNQPNPPAMSLGFEFEFWVALLFDDLNGKKHPLQGDGRKFLLTGTKSSDGEVSSKEPWLYSEENPAPTDWNPNKTRVPTEENMKKLLDELRKDIDEDPNQHQERGIVSKEDEERPELGALVEGVHQLYKQYTLFSDKGLVANDPKNPKEERFFRKDSQLYVGTYYFHGVELRTPAFVRMSKEGNFEKMGREIEITLGALTREYPVSVNAGGEVWYKPPAETESQEKAICAESRCGTHVHVGAEGVLEYFRFPTQPEEIPPGFHEVMSKRVFAAKKLLTLYWLVEPEIQQLHATWRSKDSRYSGLLRKHTNLAFYLHSSTVETHFAHDWDQKQPGTQHHYKKADFEDEFKNGSKSHQIPDEELEQHQRLAEKLLHIIKEKDGEPSDIEAVTAIWKTQSMDQLVWLASNRFGNRRGSLCLHQLLPHNSRFKGGGVREANQRIGTVEYRFMQASLDPEAVLAWAAVVRRMTEACVTGGAEDFVAYVKQVVTPSGKTTGPKAFVKRLGLSENSRPYRFYDENTQRKFDRQANPRNAVPGILVPKPWPKRQENGPK